MAKKGESYQKGKGFKEIYEKLKRKSSKKVPADVSELLGGDLFEEGKVDITSSDEKEGAIAYILEKHKSEEGHGIRYSTEIGAYNKKSGETYISGFDTVRGAFREDEPDDFEHWWKEIKILGKKGDKLTVGVSSNDRMKIYEIDLKEKAQNLLESYDLKKEREELEKNKLEKELKKIKDFDEYLKKFEEKIEKDHRVSGEYAHTGITNLDKDIAIIKAGINSNDYDPVETKVEFYLIEKGKEPIKTEESTGVNQDDRPRFSDTRAKIEYGKLKKSKDKITIPITMRIKRRKYEGNRNAVELGEKKVKLKFKK